MPRRASLFRAALRSLACTGGVQGIRSKFEQSLQGLSTSSQVDAEEEMEVGTLRQSEASSQPEDTAPCDNAGESLEEVRSEPERGSSAPVGAGCPPPTLSEVVYGPVPR